jgi:hypothetical protein
MDADRWDVVADFVQPCSFCGAACTGTIGVWYADAERRVAFETDRSSLSEPLGQLVGAAIARDEYAPLPVFVQEWNETRGWAEFASDGVAVAADDLLRAVGDLERQCPAEDEHTAQMLARLRAFVSRVANEGRELWVAET